MRDYFDPLPAATRTVAHALGAGATPRHFSANGTWRAATPRRPWSARPTPGWSCRPRPGAASGSGRASRAGSSSTIRGCMAAGCPAGPGSRATSRPSSASARGAGWREPDGPALVLRRQPGGPASALRRPRGRLARAIPGRPRRCGERAPRRRGRGARPAGTRRLLRAHRGDRPGDRPADRPPSRRAARRRRLHLGPRRHARRPRPVPQGLAPRGEHPGAAARPARRPARDRARRSTTRPVSLLDLPRWTLAWAGDPGAPGPGRPPQGIGSRSRCRAPSGCRSSATFSGAGSRTRGRKLVLGRRHPVALTSTWRTDPVEERNLADDPARAGEMPRAGRRPLGAHRLVGAWPLRLNCLRIDRGDLVQLDRLGNVVVHAGGHADAPGRPASRWP